MSFISKLFNELTIKILLFCLDDYNLHHELNITIRPSLESCSAINFKHARIGIKNPLNIIPNCLGVICVSGRYVEKIVGLVSLI